jgi:hypothetical protein
MTREEKCEAPALNLLTTMASCAFMALKGRKRKLHNVSFVSLTNRNISSGTCVCTHAMHNPVATEGAGGQVGRWAEKQLIKQHVF